MRTTLVWLALSVLASSPAQADPFAKGDPEIGRQLVQKHCISCHASSFGGDGSGIYTREDRRVKNAPGLIQQIRNCNTNLGLQWFEDDELHAAAYLNKNYYKFDK